MTDTESKLLLDRMNTIVDELWKSDSDDGIAQMTKAIGEKMIPLMIRTIKEYESIKEELAEDDPTAQQ